MAKPALTETGERLYSWLAPLFWTDEEHGWPGASFVSALAKMFDPAAEVIEPRNGKPGFATLLDPELCPEKWLPWLCQFVGIEVALAEAIIKQGKASTLREWIKAPLMLQRGSVKGIEEAAKLTLTGTRSVFVFTRYLGEPFTVRVFTIESQTPSQSETRAAAESMVPAWCKLVYEVGGGLYSEAEAAHEKYSQVEAADTSYAEGEAKPKK